MNDYQDWGGRELIARIEELEREVVKLEDRQLDLENLVYKPKLTIPFTQSDIEEMLDANMGKVFDWSFDTDTNLPINIIIKKTL